MVTGRTTVEDLLRDLAPQVLGLLVRRYNDFIDTEDALQEALLAATTQWPEQGVPDNARGWLITVAARRLADLRRSDEARKHRETRATANQPSTPAEVSDQDDSLLLLFMCCHPELAPSSAIPLTPRAVGGLSTAEIAAPSSCPKIPSQNASPAPSNASKPPGRQYGSQMEPTWPSGCRRYCTCSTSSSTRDTPPAPAREWLAANYPMRPSAHPHAACQPARPPRTLRPAGPDAAN
jgi:DNA-directed RNA polymerase specialized sigma24 family protein